MRTLSLSDATIETIVELLQREEGVLDTVGSAGEEHRALLQAISEINASHMLASGEMSEAAGREMSRSKHWH